MADSAIATILSDADFGRVRQVTINGADWWVGPDITSGLGYKDGYDAITRHVPDNAKMVISRTPGFTGVFESLKIATGQVTLINREGVNCLIAGSTLPKAKEFKHWVFGEVVPTIEKKGYYPGKEVSSLTMLHGILE